MLKTNVGKVKLNSPLLLASGYITETPDFFLRISDHASGMVTRSLKEHPPIERKNVPAPRYTIFNNSDSMLNCEWGNSTPWTEWYEHGISTVKKHGGVLILSLSGRDIESCSNLIKKFNKKDVDAYEINISCSHSGAVHGNLNVDFEHLRQLMSIVRPITKKPIWIKLSYSSYLIEMAKIAERFGADAIVCSNSIGPGLLIDTETALPKLGIIGGAGGVTGKAIFPIALNCVYLLAQTITIPIIGVGGVFTADDVIQMMMAGASAVQLYTAPAIRGPHVFCDIESDLIDFLEEHNIESIKDVIGLSIGKASKNYFFAPKPHFDPNSCSMCGRCYCICAFGAINEHIYVDNSRINYVKCISCNACVDVCPTGALTTYFERIE